MKKYYILILLLLLFSISYSQETNETIEETYKINTDNIYTPLTWINNLREKTKTEISSNYHFEILLKPNDANCELTINFNSANNEKYPIEGDNGAMLIALPLDLRPDASRKRINFLNKSNEIIEGVSLSHFSDVLLEILKQISPGIDNVSLSDFVEELFKLIGVGKLEKVKTSNTIFNESTDNEIIYVSWDEIFDQGKWIQGSTLQFTIPLNVNFETAKQILFEDKGLSLFLYAHLSCTTSNVGIMLDDILKNLITFSANTPQEALLNYLEILRTKNVSMYMDNTYWEILYEYADEYNNINWFKQYQKNVFSSLKETMLQFNMNYGNSNRFVNDMDNYENILINFCTIFNQKLLAQDWSEYPQIRVGFSEEMESDLSVSFFDSTDEDKIIEFLALSNDGDEIKYFKVDGGYQKDCDILDMWILNKFLKSSTNVKFEETIIEIDKSKIIIPEYELTFTLLCHDNKWFVYDWTSFPSECNRKINYMIRGTNFWSKFRVKGRFLNSEEIFQSDIICPCDKCPLSYQNINSSFVYLKPKGNPEDYDDPNDYGWPSMKYLDMITMYENQTNHKYGLNVRFLVGSRFISIDEFRRLYNENRRKYNPELPEDPFIYWKD